MSESAPLPDNYYSRRGIGPNGEKVNPDGTLQVSASMEEVLIAHQRQNASSCLCGWSELGRSHPGHQEAMLAANGYGNVREAQEVAWAKGATSAGLNLMALQAAGINPNPYRRPE